MECHRGGGHHPGRDAHARVRAAAGARNVEGRRGGDNKRQDDEQEDDVSGWFHLRVSVSVVRVDDI